MQSRPAVGPLTAARRCACPRCGRGRLFSGFLGVVGRCEVCGLELGRNAGEDGPAVLLIFVLGGLAVPLVFWLTFGLALPAWAAVGLASLFVAAMAVLLLRPVKAYVVALQYRHHRADFESGQ